MFATLGPLPPPPGRDDQWGYELKWDGVRAWRTPPAWYGGGADMLAASRAQGLEGDVARPLTSAYQPGIRGRDWIKTKNLRIQEVVVGGW
jgi:ATP-dependent DNA ligase